TQFNFVPTITTKEMKEITGNEDFEYILLCNKICGAAHYNMQMNIVVESKEDYEKWLSSQKQFASNN
ncbi:MAG: cytochrome c oxidase subunit II, partial [Flavobacteriales bacterium]|nr:cytochrome c oxidase subunit II [Flavobacteriales bacterium]